MSAHAMPASADIAAENHSESGGRGTLLHGTEPATEPQLTMSYDRQKSQQGQWTEVRKGTGPRDWISEEEWTEHVQENAEGDWQRSPSDVCIFRVPNYLKVLKREAYVPQRVSLGPYHHTSAQLPPMNTHKGKALRRMMTRFNNSNFANDRPDNFCNRTRKEIEKLEKKIRDNYEEKIDCNGATLGRMLSLDGCFILEILRTLGGEFHRPSSCYEPIFEQTKIDHIGIDILNDILKLENQIPLVVLQKLLEVELKSEDNVRTKLFKILVKNPSRKFYPFDYQEDISSWSWPQDQVYDHLLGLLHSLIISPPHLPDDPIAHNGCIQSISCIMLPGNERKKVTSDFPRAVELRNAGIIFGSCAGGIKNIIFHPDSATIYLPPITITDSTEVLFRNLIAFEMCKPSKINYVACYVSLMNELIDLEEDVALLRRMGVITNWLGSDREVADLFNGLGKGITVNLEDVFDQLTVKVIVHYRNEWKVKFAEFVREHFSSLWKGLTWTAALVALLLTVGQTVFSVLAVFN